jgi:two-component system OmpR family response regulator
MNARIALIEDDNVILQNYADYLRSCGFAVDGYASKPAALAGLQRTAPELVLLDISLNGERDAGFGLCAEIRHRNPGTPIVFLTSHDGEIDKISGMRLGADDYITKDVSLDYLVVRIEALFRRRNAYLESRHSAAGPSPAGAHPLALDLETSTATWRGQRVAISLTQFWMLAELCRSPGRARTHADRMRAGKLMVEPNTITAHVKAIRDAFRRIDPGFDRIQTERGRGYRWLVD